MNTSAATLQAAHATAPVRPRLDYKVGPATTVIFIGLLAVGLLYTAYSLMHDVTSAGVSTRSFAPFILLGVALLIALGFEFVNGFHDTANAVATVIYTHSLPPHVAVLWSGRSTSSACWHRVAPWPSASSRLLPVELILQVGSSAGFAMVFALLIAAILWNLGTWWLGLPASVLAYADRLDHRRRHRQRADARPRWHQRRRLGAGHQGRQVAAALAAGRLIAAALLLLALRVVIQNRKLFEAPKGNAPPPCWIRGILVLTCTGCQFAHGSNDGQKGMGLIMLILVGTVPLAYALNRAMPAGQVTKFVRPWPGDAGIAGQGHARRHGARCADRADTRHAVGLRAHPAVPPRGAAR